MKYIDLMRPIVQKAGELVLGSFRHSVDVNYKKDGSMQTDVDLLVQNFLIEALTQALPGSGVIAEESIDHDMRSYTWVIDPIDGTKNFVRGLPYFCINVALLHEQEVLAAMTYQPMTQEWFYAQKGYGAWRNGVRLGIDSRGYTQSGALVVVSDAFFTSFEKVEKVRQAFKKFDHGVRFRIGGAAALDLAYAASGSFDAVIFQNIALWDIVSGVLLISEAGGVVYTDQDWLVQISYKKLIAGNPDICSLIRSIF